MPSGSPKQNPKRFWLVFGPSSRRPFSPGLLHNLRRPNRALQQEAVNRALYAVQSCNDQDDQVVWGPGNNGYNGFMALKLDDTVCFCFHVSLRKIETFCRVERPRTPSQISDCLSAGTGCGWCVPMLKQIHGRLCQTPDPWWRQNVDGARQPQTDFQNGLKFNEIKRDILSDIDANAYAAGRKQYIAQGKGRPPASTTKQEDKPEDLTPPLLKDHQQKSDDKGPHHDSA